MPWINFVTEKCSCREIFLHCTFTLVISEAFFTFKYFRLSDDLCKHLKTILQTRFDVVS